MQRFSFAADRATFSWLKGRLIDQVRGGRGGGSVESDASATLPGIRAASASPRLTASLATTKVAAGMHCCVQEAMDGQADL